MCCQQAPMSPCYVLSASTNVSLLCAVGKHQCLLAMCCQQALMSPCNVLSTSTNISLLCAVSKHQCLLAMCCSQAPTSPCYVLLASTNVSLVCAVDKHQCLLGMCCRQAPMSSCYVVLASTNISLLCAVVNYQNLLASCGCRQARRKQPAEIKKVQMEEPAALLFTSKSCLHHSYMRMTSSCRQSRTSNKLGVPVCPGLYLNLFCCLRVRPQ